MGGNHKRLSQMLEFMDTLDSCGLRDLGYRGTTFTWNDKRSLPYQIQERLDRAVDTTDWIDMFTDAVVWNLDFFGSDHRLLHLVINDQEIADLHGNARHMRFQFEPLWRSSPEFKEMVKVSGLIVNQVRFIKVKIFKKNLESVEKNYSVGKIKV